MFHGMSWFSYLRTEDEKPKVTAALLRRVLTYARPYRWAILGMLVAILATTALSLLTPLIFRRMIDITIPTKNVAGLVGLTLLLLVIPAINGGIAVIQRDLNAKVGEGVIFDLRVALYAKLQRMSLRFFTHTRVGELMSRLNNDVVGAQNAISNTLVGIVTNVIEAIALIIVMSLLNWQLTVISIIILPLFIIAAKRLGTRLRDIARAQMDVNAQMNAMVNETINIGGALLVKLFGRRELEVDRFSDRAKRVRDLGIRRAVIGTVFFVIIGFVAAFGTALVYGIGGYLAILNLFTIGTIVAFVSYLGSLYSSLSGLANAPVEFATSVVSFERVFEVLDLPEEIEDRPEALDLERVTGDLVFDQVSFAYDVVDTGLLKDVARHGQMDSVTMTMSGDGGRERGNGKGKLEPVR